MTTKTKIFFFVIVSLAVVLIAAVLLLEVTQVFTLPTRGGVSVDLKVAVAPPLEVWAREAAISFNQRNTQVAVQIVSLKGLEAAQQLDLGKGVALPDAWIAEADFVRQMARSIPYDESGPSVAQTSLVWVALTDRIGLQNNLGWEAVHTAAVDPAQWQVWGAGDIRFDAAIPSPANSVEGVAAYLSAAATYHNQAVLNQQLVAEPQFLQWMDEILVAVPEKRLAPLNQLTRTPPSVDVGLVLANELDELNMSQFNQQRPGYNVVFNFPYLIRRGVNVPQAADKEQAAEIFRDFLLSPDQQSRLANYGLQPANSPVSGQVVQADGSTAERLRVQYR
jgi:hypothetical protein